uniref:Uncharacterized protein n=1 Tax=Heterorhabditis bacteriophora TaxID=37862 RepID=A0A1I7W6M9_HETBA
MNIQCREISSVSPIYDRRQQSSTSERLSRGKEPGRKSLCIVLVSYKNKFIKHK